MQSKILPLGALALALGFLATPASAAPVSGMDGVKGANASAPNTWLTVVAGTSMDAVTVVAR